MSVKFAKPTRVERKYVAHNRHTYRKEAIQRNHQSFAVDNFIEKRARTRHEVTLFRPEGRCVYLSLLLSLSFAELTIHRVSG